MKKFFAIALAGLLSVGLLAGCGGGNEPENNGGTNHAPVIKGVEREVTIMAGTEYDALEGVTATDEEDGNLTDKIVVTSDELTVTNGKVTPTMPNTMGYFLSYSVKDSGGKEATASTTLYVTEKVEELENVYTANFATPTVPTEKEAEARHYWELVAGEDAATLSMKRGALVVDVADGGTNAYDVLLKRGFDGFEAVKYRVVAWVESSAATSIKVKSTVDSSKYFEEKDVTLAEGYQKVEVEFNLTAAGKAWFEFHLGGEGKEDYSLSFIKIDIYKVIGTGADEELYENNFSTDSTDGAGQVYIRLDDPATGTASVENGVAKFSITKYSNDPWNVKTDVQLGNQAIENGKSYRLSFKITAEKDQDGEAVLENGTDNARAAFFTNSLDLKAGVQKELSYNFTAENDIPAGSAMLRLQVGKASDGVTSNTITIDDVKLVVPGQTERKAHDNFMLFGRDSFNKKNTTYPYLCESGSDDGHNPVDGVATAYVEDGKLVYKVYEGGANASNNKLIIGFNGEEWDAEAEANVPYNNSITLPADAMYVVSFKIKATAALKFDLCLHAMNYGGEWDQGVLYRRASWQTPEQGDGAVDVAANTVTEVSFTTSAVYRESQCELILEFGSAALKALTGGVTIEITELKIGVQRLAD